MIARLAYGTRFIGNVV